MKVFIDTNVLLDFMCKREPFYADAYALFRLAVLHKLNIIVSSLTIVNTQYTARKYGYTSEDSNVAIKNLLSIVEVSPIDGAMVRKAFSTDDKDKEDTLQYLSAMEAGADYIISRDKKGFLHSTIPTMTPTEFLSIYH